MSELFKVAIERENPPRRKKNFHATDKIIIIFGKSCILHKTNQI